MSKVAIITGASSGIGVACAKEMAATGYKIMLAARRQDRLEALVNEIGDAAAFAVCDITKQTDVENLAKATIEKFGRIDVLVNNAGIMPLSIFPSRKVEEWERMIDVNVKGVLYAIDAVLPHMMGQKDGHVINISSVAGLSTGPATGVYSATKFGVRAISESLRQEMAKQGVRVTSICPGGVKTELATHITDANVMKAFEGRYNFEFLEPESIAEAVLYAVNQPKSVCVGEIVIRPTEQA